MSTSLVALIPARSGSRRIPNKNVRELVGHPLIAYTICAALNSKVFGDVVVSTDSQEYADIARSYGASVPFLRPYELAGDMSPDFEWVEFTMNKLPLYDAFSILRPTNPFRSSVSIVKAWTAFIGRSCDSIRAVEPVRQHPGKMWELDNRGNWYDDRMKPYWAENYVFAGQRPPQPYHSVPTQVLPAILVQNASLEMAWTRVLSAHHNITGIEVKPFYIEDMGQSRTYEGLDLNTEEDWILAEALIERGLVKLPEVRVSEERGNTNVRSDARL